MNITLKFILAILLLACANLQSQEELRLAFYNVLNFPQAPPANRLQILSALVEDMRPDIFMIAELESETGGNDILVQSLQQVNEAFESAPYVNNTSSGADLQQLLYFDSNKLELLQTSIIQTTVRDINRYQLETKTDDPQILEVFVSHLKASTGDANEQLRLDMALAFTDFLETLDPDAFVVFAGDLNLYSSEEPAYQELLDTSNTITLKDPIESPGAWNNNSNFETIHTQSTRMSSDDFDDFGAGGGLDSRFDFILLSENFFDADATLSYIDASYKSYGNNGNCFNNRIDATDCDGEYNSTIRSLLYQMSDHLPVISDISVAGNFLSIDETLRENKYWSLQKTLVNDKLTLLISNPLDYPSQVLLYDQVGRLVSEQTLDYNRILDVSSLSAGVYFLTTGNPPWPTLKFIKTS